MDAISLLVEDHRRIDDLFDAVSSGDVLAVPLACNALLLHSRMEEEVLYPFVAPHVEDAEWDVAGALEDHLVMRRLIVELGEESSISPSYLTRAAVLIRLVSAHVREEEDVLFPQLRAAVPPRRLEELGDALEHVRLAASGSTELAGVEQDSGAASDGDVSWAASPLTQDPHLDRSVSAVIQRTQGL